MLKDYETRELEIQYLECIIKAIMRSPELYNRGECDLDTMQWLFNRRQGVVLEPLAKESKVLILHAIMYNFDGNDLCDAVVWFMNFVDTGEGKESECEPHLD